MADEDKYEMSKIDVPGDMEADHESSDDSLSDSSDQQDEINEAKLAELDKQISQNPYVYDNHIELIKILQEMGDLHRLRDAREQMSRYFPLSEELWLAWLRDELPLVTNSDERNKLQQLFERSFRDYQSVPIWLEFVQFSIGGMGEPDGVAAVRDSFERALSAVGLHASQGVNIWEAYREFENAITAGLMPEPGAVVSKEQEEAFSIQNQRVLAIFKRQLAVPLLHMESTLEEYKEWRGQDTVDAEVQAIFDRAWRVLQEIQPFEDRLLTVTASSGTTPAAAEATLEVYQDYIQHELKGGDPARIQCIFERAVKDHCLIGDLWLQYTTYLDKLKVSHQIKAVYERAVRNCPWSSQLWVNYLLAMERQHGTFTDMKELADKALAVGYTQASDYLAIWKQYCDYLRRRIIWDTEHDEQLETFRLTVEAAVQFLSDNFGQDGDPQCCLLQFWAFIEAKFCKNQEKSRELWNQIMQSGHGTEASLWLEYYRLERMFGDSKHCRRILQKALNSVTDWPESITQAYINFEREEGDLEQFDVSVIKCKAQLERIQERRAKISEKEEVYLQAKKTNEANKKLSKKQKFGITGQDRSVGSNLKQDHSVGSDLKLQNLGTSNKNKRKLKEHAPSSGTDWSSTLINEEAGQPQSKRARPSEQPQEKGDGDHTADGGHAHGESVQHDSSKDNITAFISNLDFSVEEDTLRQVFHQCGDIASIRLVRNYRGKSKGFGYVEFMNSNSVLQALKLDRQLVDGRPMFVSRCEDRSVVKTSHQFKYPTKMEKNKLFIKGLPFSITSQDLEAIFNQHGKIKDIRMVTYRNGSPKGIAYVEYDSETSAAQAVMKTDGLEIGEHKISVSISNPPERKTPLFTRQELPAAARGVLSLGSGKKETSLRGKARTQVSLLPRALRQHATAPPAATATTENGGQSQDKSKKQAMSNEDFRKLLK